MWLPDVNGPAQPPYGQPIQGQPPAIGDGRMPMGTNPGHLGAPAMPPATHVPMPAIPPGQAGKAMATSFAAPYLTPPTYYPATDPGIIDSPPDFHGPPVTVTSINPGGGINGGAPITRWGGQTSEDHGRSGGLMGRPGSSLVDFGEKLSEKRTAKQPQFSEDGPRNQVSPGQRGQANRSQSLPGAQSTTDLNGNRTFFKGENQRARLTIAPY